ncbi:MAG: PDZ domain-containing protein [Thermoleophilia bacterium]|nr:PDZ domain-containing protein [Thermoleophilia bacterium]
MSRLFTPGRLVAAGVVLVALAVGLALVTPTDAYIFLPDRAKPVAPLVQVEGAKPERDGGGIYFVDVLVRRATLLERYFPRIREGATIVPADVINPHGESDRDRRRTNLLEMRRSQQIAAAVALRELGYPVPARLTGVLIADVFEGAPASGRLRESDVVVAVDGTAVRRPADLRRLVSRRRPGSPVVLTVRRDGGVRRVRLRTARAPDDARRAIIGVFASQAAEIRLPLRVRIDAGNVGGPSAGLAFALDVLEKLGRDVDRGHKVAVTGEIDLDGDVGPIGGIRQKTIGAKRAGVDVFVVPAGDNAREAERYAGDVRIVPVRSFRQALRALATLPAVD